MTVMRPAVLRNRLVFASLLLLVLPALATATPATPWPHEDSDLTTDPKVTWGHLDNGLRYAVRPHASPAGQVSLRLVVGVGSLDERDEERGAARLLARGAFRGWMEATGDRLERLVQAGMPFEPDRNATSTYDHSVYRLDLPSSDAAALDDGLAILHDIAGNLAVDLSAVELGKQAMLRERGARPAQAVRYGEAQLSFLLPDAAIARRDPLPTEAAIQALGPAGTKAFHRRTYRPEVMTLIVTGAVDPQAIVAKISSRFGTLASRDEPSPTTEAPTLPPLDEPAVRLHHDAEAGVRVAFFALTPLGDGRDDRNARRARLGRELVSALLSARLNGVVRVPGSPIQSAGGRAGDLGRFARLADLTVDTTAERWTEAVSILERTLRSAKVYGFGAEERQKLVDRIRAFRAQQAAVAPTAVTLADSIAAAVQSRQVYLGAIAEQVLVDELLAELDREALQTIAGEQWHRGAPRILVSGNLRLDEPTEAVHAAYAESRARDLPTPPDAPPEAVQAEQADQPTDTPAPTFAYTDFGTPTDVVERTDDASLGITQVRFGNQVRLNLKQTAFEPGVIHVRVRFGGGRLDLTPEVAGADLLLSATFVEGGLEAHDVPSLAALTAEDQARVALRVEDDAFTLVGRTSAEHLDFQLQLLAAHLVAPGFRSAPHARFQTAVDQIYERWASSAMGVFDDQIRRAGRDGDWRFGAPPRETLEALTPEALRTWLGPALESSYLEIALVGDLDLDATIVAVGKTFGSLPTRATEKAAYTDAREVAFPSERDRTTYGFPGATDQKALALTLWPTVDWRDFDTVRGLDVLSQLFNTRLASALREMGISERPFVSSRPSLAFPGYGSLVALCNVSPERVDEALDRIEQVAANLREVAVTPAELFRIREQIAGGVDQAMAQNGLWVEMLASAQEYPHRLPQMLGTSDAYRAITSEQIQTLAKTYLVSGWPVAVVPE